jgi:hypothetical protein
MLESATYMNDGALDILGLAAHRDDTDQTGGGTLLKGASAGAAYRHCGSNAG